MELGGSPSIESEYIRMLRAWERQTILALQYGRSPETINARLTGDTVDSFTEEQREVDEWGA